MYLTGLYQGIESSGNGDSIKTIRYEIAAAQTYLPAKDIIQVNGPFSVASQTAGGIVPTNAITVAMMKQIHSQAMDYLDSK